MEKPEQNKIAIPLEYYKTPDVSKKNVEQQARNFIMGATIADKNKKLKEKLEKAVVKRIGMKGKMLVDKLFELIQGVQIIVETKDEDGTVKMLRGYKKPPNLSAIIYALDRVLGKPKQVSEHTEEKRGLIVVENIIRDLASPQKKNDESIIGKNIDTGGGGKSGGIVNDPRASEIALQG